MDKLENYRKVLQEIIFRYAKYNPSHSLSEWLPICDMERDEYLLMDVGWEKDEKRAYLTIFHFRIKDGKIYVEQDNTDAEPVAQMLEAGIPKEDIVLAFYPPSHREVTEFALA